MRIIKRAVLALAVALVFALPCSAYADSSASEADGVLNIEQKIAGNTSIAEAASSDAAVASRNIPDQDIPLSIRPYEQGWSLTNLFASLVTVIIGVSLVISSTLHRNNNDGSSNNFGLTVFGMTAAVMATILFSSTADIQTQMIAVDSFTVVHIVIMAVAILCAVLSMKKSEEEASVQLQEL
jgi:hypothetical protein